MGDGTLLDEVQEVIALPHFSGMAKQDPNSVVLKEQVVDQLRQFMETMATTMYKNNRFHNCEHASLVTMAKVKLLSRVVNPKIDAVVSNGVDESRAYILHYCTYGITSDPITQSACVFSSLIHDVGHYGVPSSTSIREESRLAVAYKRSILEQNSCDLAWNLLMQDQFTDLRFAIFRRTRSIVRQQLYLNI
jgi:hypothetical protein